MIGYGCTTCIGNSGPLPETVSRAVEDNGLVVSAVLSGNRNFEGRIHPQVRAAFLASPPLVVAYALAGTVDIDLASTTQSGAIPTAIRSICVMSGRPRRRFERPSTPRWIRRCSGRSTRLCSPETSDGKG